MIKLFASDSKLRLNWYFATSYRAQQSSLHLKTLLISSQIILVVNYVYILTTNLL